MKDIKQQLVIAGQRWICAQIDVAVEHNPRLAFIAKRLKDGLGNTLAKKVDMIDAYLPFITDENGRMNIQSVGEELLNAFDEMPMRSYEYMGLNIELGKGYITVIFPDNILASLFLDNNMLRIGRADIQELFNTLKV
jgi:hypothetical protein